MGTKACDAVMNDRQQLFVAEYILSRNATQSAIKAGYSEKTARVMGAKLLAKGNIQDLINKKLEKSLDKLDISAEKILRELAKIAFADGSDYARVIDKVGIEKTVDDDGTISEKKVIYKNVEIYNTDDLDADKKSAISSIKQTKFGIAIETYDKVKALELLGKHLVLFTDKVEADVKGDIVVKFGIPRPPKGGDAK